jgi:hypothetical protein
MDPWQVLKRLTPDVSAVSLLRQLRDGQMELDLSLGRNPSGLRLSGVG